MEPTSAATIRDLQEPLPKPDAERITGRFVLPFLTSIALIIFTGNLSFLMVLLGFVLIGFLTTLIHEFGHLIAGWCVGLHFEGVTIGPFVLRYKNRNWEFRLRRRFHGVLPYIVLTFFPQVSQLL